MTITVSTDGSALGNPNGPMGWAWADHTPNAAHTDGHEHDGDCDAGGATNGTNQIGELCAVLEALRAHPGAEPLVIETDSQYAINCSTKWVHGWKKNGWKNSQKKPVKNAALIKAIDAELTRRPGSVRFVWVKGHAGNTGNEKVDELARTYAGDCRSGVREGYLPLEGWQSLLASEYAKGTHVPEDAQMLMDGRISADEYHLGRGEESGGASTGSSAAASSGKRQVGGAGKPSLADLLAEPEGVPELYGGKDHDAATPSDKATNAATAQTTAGASPDVTHAVISNATTAVPAGTTADDATAATTDGTTDVTASASRDSRSAATPATQQRPQQAAGVAPTSGDSATPTPAATQPTGGLRPTALAVSGTLRFSPPPSSSPTYDGRPRVIHGLVAVDGYVNGDGTITIGDATFYMR
ncbi:ribonuclease H family protein [Bifidobacterium leontopitheci]|uniref:ribonuclease H n=1 Tax=Bifidobacterium leontopitheci TaxID=2650774 RepID=A0A6I1GGV7_9BIFI|nr:ribonuclease H [Bifidobacterium leontopitheci]KAB7790835.1 ribonuclease H [Bifidobacterium leontopitheci]